MSSGCDPWLRRLVTVVVTAATISAYSPIAAGQDAAESQRAEALFAEAIALIQKESYAEACPKLEESQRLDPAVGTQFNLALCYEKVGRLGSAYRTYAAVERLARAAGKKGREDSAREKMAALRPRVLYLVLTTAEPDVTVEVDGVRVEPAGYAFVAIDAGDHTIEASAPMKRPWQTRVSVADDTSARATPVAVPRLAGVEGTTRIITVTKDTSSSRRTAGLVIGAAGIVALGAAAVTGVLVLDRHATASDRCNPTCDQEGRDAVASAKVLLPLNVVAWIAAAAGVGLGSFLFFTSPSPSSPSPALQASP